MHAFIFITLEGHTFQPNSESDVPDVLNLQVLGFAAGVNTEDAFRNLVRENEWLRQTTFDQVKCLELASVDYEKQSISFSLAEFFGGQRPPSNDYRL